MATVRELTTLLKYKLDESGLRGYTRNAQRAGKQVGTAGKRATRPWTTGMVEAKAATAGLISRAKRLLGVYLGFRGIKSILTTSGNMAQLNHRLREALGSAQEFNRVYGQLRTISQRFPSSLQTNIRDFTRMNQLLQDTNVTTQEQVDLLGTLQAGMIASAGDTSRASQLMRRFARSLGQGAIQTSVINSLLDTAPELYNALLKGLQKTNPELGATADNLRDLAGQGKLTTDIVLPALKSQMEDLKKAADNVPLSLSDAMIKLRNSFTDMIGRSQEAGGALSGVVKAINFVGEHLEGITKIVVAFGVAWGLSEIIKGLGFVAAGIKAIRDGWIAATVAEYAFLLPYILIGAAIAGVVLLLQDVYTWITDGNSLLQKAWEYTKDWAMSFEPVRNVVQWISDKISTIINSITSMVRKLREAKSWVSDTASGIGESVSGAAAGAWDWIKSPFVDSGNSTQNNSQTNNTTVNVTTNSDNPRDIGEAVSHAVRLPPIIVTPDNMEPAQ